MAVLKLGAIVTSISGKLGGHVFIGGKQIPIIRTKANPLNKVSIYQSAIRTIVSKIATSWRLLTNLERETWYNKISYFSSIDTFGISRELTAKNLHQSLNQNLLYTNQPLINIAPFPDATPYFLLNSAIISSGGIPIEIIINGDFATNSDWVLGFRWSISGGQADAFRTSGTLSQLSPLIISSNSYLLSYEIKNYIQGSIRPQLNGIGGAGIVRNANGVYLETIIAGSSGNSISFTPQLPFWGAIDNVSLFASGGGGGLSVSLTSGNNLLGEKVIISATKPLNFGVGFSSKLLRDIAILDGTNQGTYEVSVEYIDRFGSIPSGANIYFGVKTINSIGQASPLEHIKAVFI